MGEKPNEEEAEDSKVVLLLLEFPSLFTDAFSAAASASVKNLLRFTHTTFMIIQNARVRKGKIATMLTGPADPFKTFFRG